MLPVNQREHSTGVLYNTSAPEGLNLNEVTTGDLYSDGANNILFQRDDEENWIPLNDWQYIQNKPSSMTPTVHGLNSDRHSGRLPIAKVSGHTITEPVHQQVASIGFLVGLTSGEI